MKARPDCCVGLFVLLGVGSSEVDWCWRLRQGAHTLFLFSSRCNINAPSSEKKLSMSLSTSAYLRSSGIDLDRRVLQRLAAHGFKVALPPGATLLQTPASGTLWLAVHECPESISRIEPAAPFLTAFEYWTAPRSAENHSYAPRGVRKYEIAVHTRTSSGRSPSAATFQQLILGAMAAESQGWYLADGDEQVWVGEEAFAEVLRQATMDAGNIDEFTMPFDGWHENGEPIQHRDRIRTSQPSIEERARNIVLPKRKWWRWFF